MSLLAGCFEGGSDGIENPKVELDLRGPDGGATGTGVLRVYASDMNPVADSQPLMTKAFSGAGAVEITASEVDSLLRLRLGNPASLPDTQIAFNVVAVSGDREAFVAGFRYKREGQRAGFAFSAGGAVPAFADRVKTQVKLQDAVMGFEGAVGGAGVQFGIDYVYIPGSPYHAEVEKDATDDTKGGFRFNRMSKGSYKGLVGADEDSATFFESDDVLDTDSTFNGKTWNPITIIDR